MNSEFMHFIKVLYAAILVHAVIGRLEYLLETAEAIAVRSQSQHLQHVAGIGGTTSVRWCSSGSSLVIGTKKGGIYWSSVQKQKEISNNDEENPSADGNWEMDDEMVRWSKLESKEYKTKYPIYSMATALSSFDDDYLFCGSGDRWISVWKLSANAISGSDAEFVQKLGPHTGWVKDIVYDEESRLLHSIGCNCVESWDCSTLIQEESTTHKSSIIAHTTKRAIENSPTMGTTLSSDLLCLCLLPPTKSSPRLLVTGGVDGRILLWLSDPTTFAAKTNLDGENPLHTASAHDGRVNKIVYSSTMNTIFTVGNDGLLCAFRASIEEGFEEISKLKIDAKSSLRITVASIMSGSGKQGRCYLALGSSNGELFFVKAQINPNDGIDFSVQDDSITLEDGSMVYSMISEKGSDRSRLWVGHASGLAAVDRYL